MEFRDPRTIDIDRFENVAARSMRASYGDALDDDTVDNLVDQWYDPDRIEQVLNEEATIWRVADVDDDIAGFVQGALLNTDPISGEVHWIHVDPDARDGKLDRQLLGSIQDTIEDRGANRLEGYVLVGNDYERTLYEETGFEKVDEHDIAIGDEEHREHVYEKSIDEDGDEGVVETVSGPDGELYVDYSEGDRGTEAPMFPTYQTEGLDEQYGWYCSYCDSVDTNMGPMGRIECQNCENMRKSTRWDNVFL